MSNIAIKGAATGTGVFTLESPATNTNRTLTLPDEAGTMALQGGAGVGKVLQVVSANTTTSVPTTSTSFVTTSFSASITPTSATSKIFIIVAGGVLRTSTTNQGYLTLYRDAINIGNATRGLYQVYSAGGSSDFPISISAYDAPATTSATAYTLYLRTSSGTSTFEVDAAICTLTLMEIAA